MEVDSDPEGVWEGFAQGYQTETADTSQESNTSQEDNDEAEMINSLLPPSNVNEPTLPTGDFVLVTERNTLPRLGLDLIFFYFFFEVINFRYLSTLSKSNLSKTKYAIIRKLCAPSTKRYTQ